MKQCGIYMHIYIYVNVGCCWLIAIMLISEFWIANKSLWIQARPYAMPLVDSLYLRSCNTEDMVNR